MRRMWRDYNLGIVLFLLFFVSWIGQTYTGWKEFIAEQQSMQQTAHVFGCDGYVWMWLQATLENWQSEFLQLFAMVVLTACFIFKGSPESKDSDEEQRAKLDHLIEEVSSLRAELLAVRGGADRFETLVGTTDGHFEMPVGAPSR